MELQIIQSKIYEIRGQKVMLDRDLAELYQVETRVLNQAVKRNIKRFPSDFMFQVTEDEFEILKSQFVISSWGGVRKLPFAFTEQGLAMLSGILNSDVAIEVNISIMRAFVAVRRLMANPPDYNDINDDTRMQIELINQTIAELQAKDKDETKHRNPIGFNTYKK